MEKYLRSIDIETIFLSVEEVEEKIKNDENFFGKINFLLGIHLYKTGVFLNKISEKQGIPLLMIFGGFFFFY